MGFELLSLPYAFDHSYAGSVGYSQSPSVICGSLAHSDENGNLIWFNGGLSVDRDTFNEVLMFEFYSTDDNHGVLGAWEQSGDSMRSCFKPALANSQIKVLGAKEKGLLDKYILIHQSIGKGN